MNRNEFDIESDKMLKRHNLEKFNLSKEYATSNNPVKINDIISDGSTIFAVSKMKISQWGDYPSMSYYGIWQTKKGIPNKKNEHASILQSRLKSINGVPYEL